MSIAIMFHLSGWRLDIELLAAGVWVVFPYFVIWSLSRKLHKSNLSGFSEIAMAYTICAFLFTLLGYGSFYTDEVSSTSALVFLFLPIYLIIGAIVFLGLSNIICSYKSRQNKDTA